MPNPFIKMDDLDRAREKEAKRNPLYDPRKRTWVVNVVDGCEVSCIRRNFRHGFISLGWGGPDSNEKIIVGDLFDDICRKSKQERDKRLKFLKERATVFAAALNRLDLKGE